MCRRSRCASGLSSSASRSGDLGRRTGLGAFDLREPFLEREPFRYLPHDLPGPVEVPLEFRQADDLGREATAGALRADPILIVDLIEADRDDVRTDLVEDRVDVPLVPEERTVDRFEASTIWTRAASGIIGSCLNRRA